MPEVDLLIRGGTIFDGRGGAPFVSDLAISGDRIAAIGDLDGYSADEEIDASGLIVTPGFVDVHTHFDGQVIWSDRLSPSSGHGVTTVVIGNCGVGFAPCRAEDRVRLIKLMEGIEDIPGIVMTEGLTWDWESYPEYLDQIEQRPHDINIASFLPHSALRVFVMGERAAAGEPATAQDLAAMSALVREAAAAGAIGFGTSRTLYHRSSDGGVVPTLDAAETELNAIAEALAAEGDGILQIATDYKSHTAVDEEFAMMRRVAERNGRLLMLPTVQMHSAPEDWQDVVRLIEQANDEGVAVRGQVMPRGIGMLYGLELSMHPFCLTPSYRAIAHLPLTERLAVMRNSAKRAEIIDEKPLDPPVPLFEGVRMFDGMFEMSEEVDYEPSFEDSIAARAGRAGIRPEELAYDLLVQGDGITTFFMPFSNYFEGNLDVVHTMLRHKNFVPGLGDAGAHLGAICDGSYSTFMLSHWTRDRTRGARLPLAKAVKALAHDTAQAIGLNDRGVLAPGYKADVNIIDYDRLKLHRPRVEYDLPAGGRRLTQDASGYVATIVNGEVVYRDGEPTGVLPGELVRGTRQEPMSLAAE